jgi:hypothetical protein
MKLATSFSAFRSRKGTHVKLADINKSRRLYSS